MSARGRCDVWVVPVAPGSADAVAGLLAAALASWDARPAPLVRSCRRCGSTAHGRPALSAPDAPAVSWSRTRGAVALALTDAPTVGVDVEGPHPDRRLDTLADWVWTPRERAAAATAPDAGALLLRDWARKEAVLKAWGWGLALPMAEVDLADRRATRPGERDLVVHDLGDLATVWGAPTASGIGGAVAVPPGVAVRVLDGRPLLGRRRATTA
ncbi:4'-phosphopantetheinyl transferase superfamily protein [Propioniciclava coleopterorum]|uniref:4'-phosphopantetheinyl transferase superfamily protein n=1 Tax=Propioniciclava coleopterorum TaxID=2714937 RepID=A0A6G7Y6J2_9ACTN|nr:4'-phosphopantetheinyl transferase superfamily protein [Propioniciclava coleopterorum]QIK72514.1 4'-phosphopantetheinyl transferase superfamily protein [Propioniciclava coleopterorum]